MSDVPAVGLEGERRPLTWQLVLAAAVALVGVPWAVVSGVNALGKSLSADRANTVDLVLLLAVPAVMAFAVVSGFTWRTGRGSVRSWAGVLAPVGLVNGALWGAGSASRGGDGNLVVAAASLLWWVGWVAAGAWCGLAGYRRSHGH